MNNNYPSSYLFCPRCGRPLYRAGDSFCIHCGAPQKQSDSSASSAKSKLFALLKCAAYVALFFGVQLIVTFATIIIVMLNTDIGGSPNEIMNDLMAGYGKWAWLDAVVELVIIIAVLAVFFAVRKKSIFKELSVKRLHPASFGALTVCGVGAQFAAVLLLACVYALFPILAEFSVSEDLGSMMGAGFALDFIFIAVVTPLMEEIIFRGLVYTRLRRAMPRAASIVLCGVIFGAVHMNIEQFLYAAPLGMLMAAVFEKYGSLWAPFAIHFAFNGGNYLAGYLPEKPETLPICAMIIGVGFMIISMAFIFGTSNGAKGAPDTSQSCERTIDL